MTTLAAAALKLMAVCASNFEQLAQKNRLLPVFLYLIFKINYFWLLRKRAFRPFLLTVILEA